MFNSIYADILCPIKKEMSRNTEIQIKWQDREVRTLEIYHLGDVLEEILDEYNNKWIRTDYICQICSKYTIGRDGTKYIKTEDQKRHFVFVRMENAKISEIISEDEFRNRGLTSFVDYC